MSDLIKRSDVIEAIESVDWYHQNSNKDMVHGANSNDHQPWYKAQDIYEALEAVPSAGRPQGKWIRTEYSGRIYGLYRYQYKCSRCRYVPTYRGEPIVPTNATLRYCPKCGTRMRGIDKRSKQGITICQDIVHTVGQE